MSPGATEMIDYVQVNMGISRLQAEIILDELGFIEINR